MDLMITKEVVDLRSQPCQLPTQDFSHQDLRETQLLFGEKVRLLERQGEWLKISALEQTGWNENEGWHPCPGWIHQSEVAPSQLISSSYVVSAPTVKCGALVLSYGTYIPNNLISQIEDPKSIRLIPQKIHREQIGEDARHFLGAPYLWGGRSFPLKGFVASVDCSGIVNLLYRGQGMLIPRNSHDQYLKGFPTNQLKPGDPLYLAKEKRINHVILKIDDQTFIESPQTGQHVRLLKWGSEIWEEKGRIQIFDRPYSYTAFPRTFYH